MIQGEDEMKILVINAGSSSLKYQLIDMDNEQMLAKGNCEKIGLEMGIFGHKTADGREKKIEIRMANHTEAFEQVKNALLDSEVGVIKDLSEVAAIGHRIVQGGALFSESVLVDEKVIEGIESLIPLAPLHNSAHVQGIRACMSVFGKEVPEVVVFDTAFHSTMPQKAYMFAVPYEYYEKYKIRRYGFHGTSHRYVSHRVAELMGKDIKDLKLITCHIGNGSSITAIKNGKVIDTSMGLTPLDGFMMGTRTARLIRPLSRSSQRKRTSPRHSFPTFSTRSPACSVSPASPAMTATSARQRTRATSVHTSHMRCSFIRFRSSSAAMSLR